MKSSGQHQARKRFGQNFLVDEVIIGQIVRSIAPKEDDAVVEIGPGQGAITRPLLSALKQLHVVELDRDLVQLLKTQFAAQTGLHIHSADALRFDFDALSEELNNRALRVVGNLPYNISTPLIFHLLTFRDRIQDMHFMLQKEVVHRMCAASGDKSYGRLSIMCQYYCQVDQLFEVPPYSFRPAPKVDSAIVRLSPHKTLPLTAHNSTTLNTVVKTAFQQRRKTLRNALKSLVDDPAQLTQLPVDLTMRPENLTVADYVNLANTLDDTRMSGVNHDR